MMMMMMTACVAVYLFHMNLNHSTLIKHLSFYVGSANDWPVWTLVWSFKLDILEKAEPQSMHTWGFSPKDRHVWLYQAFTACTQGVCHLRTDILRHSLNSAIKIKPVNQPKSSQTSSAQTASCVCMDDGCELPSQPKIDSTTGTADHHLSSVVSPRWVFMFVFSLLSPWTENLVTAKFNSPNWMKDMRTWFKLSQVSMCLSTLSVLEKSLEILEACCHSNYHLYHVKCDLLGHNNINHH